MPKTIDKIDMGVTVKGGWRIKRLLPYWIGSYQEE